MEHMESRIIDLLVASGNADASWSLIVLAALQGEQQLNDFLDGKLSVASPTPQPASGPAPEPPGAYLGGITVEGFRGVGPRATLAFRPGPGLTLVVGRNGSGKSSFAEGIEYLLTGKNYRWEKRAKVWVEGWRNLHHQRAALKADVLVEGKGSVTLSREWNSAELAGNKLTCVGPNKRPESFQALGWSDALVTFRPFLSYNELGSLLEEGPSKLYDALSNVLGLEQLVAVQNALASARKARQTLVDEASEGADEIRGLLDGLEGRSDGDRVTQARKALKGANWDIPALAKLAGESESPEAAQIEMLRRLEALVPIDTDGVASAVQALRSAARALADLGGTDALRSRKQAALLDQALAYHEHHTGEDCPVCRTPGVLTSTWVASARKEVARLRTEAGACEAAEATVKARIREAQRHFQPPPSFLAQAADLGVAGLPGARRLWLEWIAGREIDDPTALANHLETRALEFSEAVRQVAENAADERSRRENVWRPIVVAIAGWLPNARKALQAKERIKQIKAAEEWWKETSATVRDERFAPIADRARAVWNQLRLQSNVDLGGVVLEGTAQRRRVTLRVTVDGTPAEALGVMSQGELHSLALSLFLPRATLSESPFRFICIDDPVQSMDPARVEGLAKTLADAARTRQVIVFTHDDRLPEAVRRLGLPATVHSVTRRAHSVVEVRETRDPVSTLIDDARAVAMTEDLPADVARRVVPGFCRAAVEAACMESIRRRRLAKGETHETVEDLLAANARTYPLLALALFDDEKRTNDVIERLKKLGTWATDVVAICRSGAHELHDGDIKTLVKNSERLATVLAAKA